MSSGSVDVARSHFDSPNYDPAVSDGTYSFIKFGCIGAMSRPEGERINLLPGLLPRRRTNGVGGSNLLPGISVAIVGTDRVAMISMALPTRDIDLLGGPSASQVFVGVASGVRIKHDIV